MNTASDRRAPGTTRIPFDAMVEVGGALGPSFEAQAVNLSEEGMQLRTAYLPEVGQPITCRFDAGQGVVVVAAGEVLWNEDQGGGGEFGIRFTNLDAQSTVALQRVLGMVEEGAAQPRAADGRKVRLHIDGLASPMRARLKGQPKRDSVTAFSELGFLQVGKALELEDAASGDRRPALIDRVSVEVEQASRIPQLVVTLRYDDEEEMAGADPSHPMHAQAAQEAVAAPRREPSSPDAREARMSRSDAGRLETMRPEPMNEVDDSDEFDDAYAPEGAPVPMHSASPVRAEAHSGEDGAFEDNKLKGSLVAAASKITPAVEKWAKRAKTTFAVLAARAAAKRGPSATNDVEIPLRRTTAPAPGGGLHTAGRKVVRGEVEDKAKAMPEANAVETGASGSPFKITKKKAAVAGSIAVAGLLAAFALHKPAPAAPLASAPPADSAIEVSAAAGTPGAPAGSAAVVGAVGSPVAPGVMAAGGSAPGMVPVAAPTPPVNDPLAQAAAAALGQNSADEFTDSPGPHKKVKPAPFGSGPVAHGNVMRIKMDGAIEKIQGASQPTGFTVLLPNRKSLEAAGPLAAKDPRIAAIRMSNETSGAELTVTFKDGVPNYLVRAKGDTLELVLARAGQTGEKAPEAHATTGKKKKEKDAKKHH